AGVCIYKRTIPYHQVSFAASHRSVHKQASDIMQACPAVNFKHCPHLLRKHDPPPYLRNLLRDFAFDIFKPGNEAPEENQIHPPRLELGRINYSTAALTTKPQKMRKHA